ncbi:sodium-dependent bicarbonate transport family permease [Pseudaeromonas sharmana]|uniref:Sodium-dependent bicarbonate transport family permease n=1 Tax=Pseudaeromonas sharmana TaxID=328412 RepID=A0ABV8CR59_9GAMM
MLDPVVLFFLLGLVAGLLRAELRLPAAIYDFLSVLLLLTIGLKGGVELAEVSAWQLLPQLLGVLLMGLVLPLLLFPLLRLFGRLKRADAASLAAHYGSVSVGTFAVAVAFLSHQNVAYESYMPVFVVMLEMPAILVGILLARGLSAQTRWCALGHELFCGKGIMLLLGGLLIGWACGREALQPVTPLFFDLYKGVLALFLLEMGLITASQMGMLRRHGLFLLAFGLLTPLVAALIGGQLAVLLGFSVGGTMLLATLAASASYIAVPAAMRMAVPEANPGLSLAASLGVTFPFNVLVGIPLYLQLAHWLHAQGG